MDKDSSKQKSFRKPLLVGCGTIAVLVAVVLAVGAWLFLRSEALELSAHHPFRSAEAKEKFLKSYDAKAAKWPVPSESRTVETSYGQTFVRISGPDDAPPLVLLHGIGGNSLQWAPNIAALSESFRTYGVDNIYDYGRSRNTRAMQRPDDLVGWLDGLFSALELEGPFHLMGLSYGGWLTSQYALRFPDRLDKIVLLAPACTVLPIRLEWFGRAILCAVPHRSLTRNFMCWLLADLAQQEDGAGRAIVEEWADNAFLAMRSFKPRRVVPPTVLEDAELEGMKVPAFFLVGENEKIYSAQKAIQRLGEVAPHIRTEIIPGAGHDLTIVQADVVNRKVLEFLQGP